MDANYNRPPVLDGSNYHYWQIRMRTYIKSLDGRSWRSILEGYTWPTEGPDADGDIVPIPEERFTAGDILLSSYNEKALNAIFGHVDALICLKLFKTALLQNKLGTYFRVIVKGMLVSNKLNLECFGLNLKI